MVIGLGLTVLLSSMAMGAAAWRRADQGVSVTPSPLAATPANPARPSRELGHDGRRAAWWFLVFESPFLVSYGLLLCAGCAFAAGRLAAAGADRLARIARFAVPFGLLAAGSDLIQNLALVVNLTGHFAQPAPRIAQVCGDVTWVFGIAAGFVFVAGWIVATLRSRRAAPR